MSPDCGCAIDNLEIEDNVIEPTGEQNGEQNGESIEPTQIVFSDSGCCTDFFGVYGELDIEDEEPEHSPRVLVPDTPDQKYNEYNLVYSECGMDECIPGTPEFDSNDYIEDGSYPITQPPSPNMDLFS